MIKFNNTKKETLQNLGDCIVAFIGCLKIFITIY